MRTPEDFPPYAIAFYQTVIDEHLHLAVKSFATFHEIADDGTDAAAASIHLNSALSNCASIARYFDPVKRSLFTDERTKRLREAYDIADDSALLNRQLRNFIEHLDERIDRWLELDPVGPIVPSTIFAHHSIIDDGIGHAFRVIDHENDVYVGLGTKFDYGGIAREAVRLYLREEN